MKNAALLIILLVSHSSWALRLYSIFQPECQRTSGLMVFVDDTHVYMLTAKGIIESVPLFHISGIVEYSLPQFPVSMLSARESQALAFRFYSSESNSKELLSQGFVTDFNKSSIQVYDISGQEKLVLREKIWSLDSDIWGNRKVLIPSQQKMSFRLRSPLIFEQCKDEDIGTSATVVSALIPERTYTNVVARKEFIDLRRAEYQRLLSYESRQQFYSRPNVYKNRTRMGTWLSLNTRYTNIGVRQTNFLPFIEDEFSSDIFSYQHVIKSGSIPIRWSFQDEPQLQVYYGLKADYIHLDLFLDPSVILAGDKYRWSSEQIKSIDDRFVEFFGIKFGIDYSKFSLFVAGISGEGGVRTESQFLPQQADGIRTGLSFQHHDLTMDVSFGSFNYTPRELKYSDLSSLRFQGPAMRLNIGYQPAGYGFELAYIYRSIRSTLASRMPYEASSHILVGEYSLNLVRRWTIYLRPSLEQLVRPSGSKLEPKAATGLSLEF